MTVRELLNNQIDCEIKVYQVPIKEIDSCEELVMRYQGEISVSLNSNQNYLDFIVEHYYHDNGYLVLVCRANKEQEQRTINAHRSVERARGSKDDG